ncbi:MAG: carbon monoxide dehydrogenase subunit G [Chloroflexi bacterium]|nr:carbon monoxide dehydrogenase subunit G [Chloroflexota bacterium]MCI0790040.1 carbon monoxide dehydrogenase subunit G [Chloroflexota bacterium]MCI0800924.1 carbon monoxide dehydrogenase subunit G [Chloroflexota bacterium]MCI0812141.1 carbon monoxide dehydrogenase subunit G [Chloroflexota bacterium]MCI0830762.1 carbon monoxide dehydrogenase subunit G [Chloroflexota bacterium]
MKLSGSYEFNAPPEKVWQTLTDPESLSSCIPGCEKMESLGNDEYTATVTIAMGPIRSKFEAKVKMIDMKPYESYSLVIEGNGPSGFVRGESQIKLTANNGKTIVDVESDTSSGGLLARVGQRMIESFSRNMMDRFFTCLQESVK